MAVEPARAVAMDAARRASPESPRTVVARRLAATVFTGAEGLDLETLSARVSAICALLVEKGVGDAPERSDERERLDAVLTFLDVVACERDAAVAASADAASWCWYALAHPHHRRALRANATRTLRHLARRVPALRHAALDVHRTLHLDDRGRDPAVAAALLRTPAAVAPADADATTSFLVAERCDDDARPHPARVPLPDIPSSDDAAGTGTGTGTGTVVRPIPSDDPRVALRGRLGLFASRDWSPGETISEYAGALVSLDAFERTFAGAFAARAAHRSYAVLCEGTLAGVPGPLMICAFDPKLANDSRFINDPVVAWRRRKDSTRRRTFVSWRRETTRPAARRGCSSSPRATSEPGRRFWPRTETRSGRRRGAPRSRTETRSPRFSTETNATTPPDVRGREGERNAAAASGDRATGTLRGVGSM
jgi:hypothetical protein